MREPWHDFATGLSRAAQPAVLHLRWLVGAGVDARFDVHRRNRLHALTEALMARHPLLVAIVGEEFARALVNAFVSRVPPRSASLLDYGRDLGDFLDAFPPARSVACVPDIARFESTLQDSFDAAEALPLELRELAARDGEALLRTSFVSHPATRFFPSAHPVATLWHAHRAARAPAPLERYAGECAVIVRPHAEVGVLAFPIEARRFLQSLFARECFEDAASQARGFDPVTSLRLLIEAGAFVAIADPPATPDPTAEHTAC